MLKSALTLALLVFSMSMVVAAVIMPRPPAEPAAVHRTAAETIEDTVARQ